MNTFNAGRESWYNETRPWTVYLLSKGGNKYVGITSKSLRARLTKHKKMALNPTRLTPINIAMQRAGLNNWRMKKLASLKGTFYEAREIERTYLHLSNLNQARSKP